MLLLILNYTALLIYIYIAMHAYRANSKHKLNRLFSLLCLIFAVSTLMEILINNTSLTPQSAFLLNQISQLPWLNYPGLMLLLAFFTTRNEKVSKHPRLNYYIFIPGLLLSVLELFIVGRSLNGSQALNFIRGLEYFYTYCYLFISLSLVWQWKKYTPWQREKRQAEIILNFGIVAIVVGAVNDLIMPHAIRNYPFVDQFIFLIFIFSIWYANVKYKFVRMSSLITAEDVVNKINEIVIVMTPDGHIINVNPAGEKATGYSKDELIDKPIQSLINLDFEELVQEVARLTEGIWEDDYYLRTRSNIYLPITVGISAVKDITGDIIGALVFCQDKTMVKELQMEINERRIKERQLKYLSLHDPLTGLHNRTFFEQQMRRQKGECGIIICDVDGLKLINDTLGHEVGDQLLTRAAMLIQSSLDKGLSLSRIGGDEFAVLIPRDDREKIQEICDRISLAVADYNLENPQLMLSISVGSAVCSGDVQNIIDVFKEADDNMYRQKLNHTSSFRSNMVQGMMKTLEARDFITEGHAERMRKLIMQLGAYVGVPNNMLTSLQLLAQFHDIGKIGISDKILFKPALLTENEITEMQRHSEIGYRIAQAIHDLSSISDLILKHHESWDGTGYPLRLKGTEIPLECRILSIVDAFDAMTNDRPYRKAMSEEEAIAIIRNNAGAQFDPELVESFLLMLEENNQLDEAVV
ncbi:MAG: HD domain-containing phosphohydrolase [Syntrophomonadaceae bacterium]